MVDLPDDQKSMVYLPKVEVDQLWTTFQLAEQQIKALERDEGDGLDVPSINQLRYVAHHLLKALVSRNTGGDLLKAINHAHRALFDAHEAQSIDTLSAVDKFFDDYRLVDVTEAIPNYVVLRAEVANIRKSLKNIPRDDGRSAYYREATVANHRLQEIRLTFEASRDVLNVKIKRKRNEIIRWAVGLVVAGLVSQVVIRLVFP